MATSSRISRFVLPVLAGCLVGLGMLWLALSVAPAAAGAAGCWQAAITEQWTDLTLAGSVLRVSVQGQAGLTVVVRAREGNFQTSNLTGTKPEYGPYVAEFAPLSRGTYVVEPQGLGLAFEVWLDGHNYTRIDLTSRACQPTPTPTLQPSTPTRTPRPAATATRQATATATPTRTAALQPTATSAVPAAPAWRARVVQHVQHPDMWLNTIVVRVTGQPAGQVVEIRSNGFSATCKTGTKPEYGGDACEFGGLGEGSYTLTPVGLGVGFPLAVTHNEFYMIEFYAMYGAPPAGPTATPTVAPPAAPAAPGWRGWIVSNSSGGEPQGISSVIVVRVLGRGGVPVSITGGGDWTATCITGTKPEYGGDACEFGGLWAATYYLRPEGADTEVAVTMDGAGIAFVEFQAP